MSDTINYGQLMHDAMRGLLAKVLKSVAKDGLPGKHHFFITFETGAPGVDLPDWLHERYPEDMTIVMQDWFADLNVTKDSFSVTLNFGDEAVPMTIPFEAVRTFVDPSVEFGLRFEATDDEGAETMNEGPMIDIPEDEPQGDAEVVSLDSFRPPPS